MATSVIYQSCNKQVVLLDLPRSIEDAQASPSRIWSTTPRVQPYANTEPKGAKLDKLIALIPSDEIQLHRELQDQLQLSLDEVRGYLQRTGSTWCYRRFDAVQTYPDSAKHAQDSGQSADKISVVDKINPRQCLLPPIILSSTEETNAVSSLRDITGATVHNPHGFRTSIIDVGGDRYFVPPASTFLLSSLQAALPRFKLSTGLLLPATVDHPEPGQFDLILMDPPWPNRSARHAHAYVTADHQAEDPFSQTLTMVRNHLVREGLIATWVTNKPSVRAQVLRVLQQHGFHLHEEWVWLKITSMGESVTQLDGVWRKPYEVLLLLRRAPRETGILRRSIIAVPDFHSRKPSLKTLLEEMLPPKYRALELFARSLTAGWWSLGDEVLKFQHESQWQGV